VFVQASHGGGGGVTGDGLNSIFVRGPKRARGERVRERKKKPRKTHYNIRVLNSSRAYAHRQNIYIRAHVYIDNDNMMCRYAYYYFNIFLTPRQR